MSSGYDLAWACPASEPLILAAGAERTDTLSIFGPTGRDGQTQAPLGALDGDFVLHYGTSAGTLNSAVFRVKRAPEDAAYVTLLNDGATTLTNVRVVTSEKDSVPLAMTLAPGQRLGPYRVAALHTNPYVAALLQGRSVVSHPVEGFSGFNPRLASGAYVVRLRTTTEGMLDVRVVQDGL